MVNDMPADDRLGSHPGGPPSPPEVDSVAPEIERGALEAGIDLGAGHTPVVPPEAIGADLGAGADLDRAAPTAPGAHGPDGNGRLARPVQHRGHAPLGQPVDALTLWDDQDDGGRLADLTVVRIDQDEGLVVPFTTTLVRVALHFVNYSALRGYLRCNAPDCLLCRVGKQPEIRDLLPVYDLVQRVVAVLPISPNSRAHALQPQLAPVLRRVAGGEGPLLVTLRKDGAKFVVGTTALPEGADNGAAAIRAFRERFDAGLVDLATSFQMLENEDLAAIDEIRAIMAAKGVVLR
jgi:hypothetical protein